MNEILDEPQGWYLDPYGVHELRWFSAGKPTALVRDAGVDGHDAPPPGPPPTQPVPAPEVAEAQPSEGNATAAQQTFSAAFGNIAVQP
jgi:hypothetical protein